jgi:photosystem II stability/assembly factor-like uncharacterized protein
MKKYIFIFTITFLYQTCLFSQAIWVQQNSGTTQNLNKFYNYSIVGDNGLYMTTSSFYGSNWIIKPTGFTNNFYDKLGDFIVGSNGLIIKYDLSNTWTQILSGTTNDLKCINSNSNRWFIAGNNGTYIRSTNNGSNWTTQTISANNLNSIVINNLTLIIAGDNGTILKSTNYGINWQNIISGTTNKLNQIILSSANSLFICGDNGTLLRSTDSGDNWFAVNTGFNTNFKSISPTRYSGSSYWIATSDGKILYSPDGLNSWSIIHSRNYSLNNISTYYALGDNGTISYYDIFVYNTQYIDCNTIRTPFRNNGSFDRDPETGNSGFEWPIGSSMTALYASGLWLGGIINTDTLVAIAEFDYEFLKGYTDNSGNPQGKLDSNYRVYRLDYGVNNWERTKWPNALLGNSDQGAPVYYDNLSNSWKPLDFGTQTMYMVYTDSYPESHGNRAGSTAPLKADIKMVNFANAGTGPLSHTILSYYHIINRSNNVWSNFYISLWTDDDLGYVGDDKEGCDTLFQLGYAYNGNDNDPIYGTAPPAVGFLLLKGPTVYTGNPNDTAEYCLGKVKHKKPLHINKKMYSFIHYRNADPVYGDPRDYRETYRYMKGLKRDGTQWVNPVTNQVTTFVYSGDPVTGQGWNSNWAGNNRFMFSCGPLSMNPGDTQTIVFAQIIARGTSNLNSITVLREYATAVRNYYNSCYTNVPIGIEPFSNQLPDKLTIYQNYPNPFNPTTKIKFDIPQTVILSRAKNPITTLKIYDILGRNVRTLINEQLKPGTYEIEFDGKNYASGIYYYTLTAGDYFESKKMLMLK